jgi:hypothetical protein
MPSVFFSRKPERRRLMNSRRLALMVIAIVLVMIAVTAAKAQTPETVDLIGTWKLVSVSIISEDGKVINPAPYGQNPIGYIIYTPDRMMVVVTYSGRKKISGDRLKAPEAERAEAYTTSFAYSGRYTRKGDTVIHHAELSAYQNEVGTDQVRKISLEGGKVVLTTPPLMREGKPQVYRLVWERSK